MLDDYSASLIDESRPNAGRIYDYFLGGNLHFEVDRKAAEEIIKVMPFVPDMSQLVRWFLGEGLKKALELGLTQFIDFASGLPTASHLHRNVPAGIKVLYSDIDPVTVEHGKRMIGDNPDVRYETCDIRTPEVLLNSAAAQDLIGTNRKVAVGFNGVAYFLTDEQIKKSMQTIYDWVDAGSILYFSDFDLGTSPGTANRNAQRIRIADIYKNMNQPVYSRSMDKMKELVSPWTIMEPGLVNLEEWYEMPPEITQAFVKLMEYGTGLYGGILKK